jgi:hypothetical protein
MHTHVGSFAGLTPLQAIPVRKRFRCRNCGGLVILALAMTSPGPLITTAAPPDESTSPPAASTAVSPQLPASVDLRPAFDRWGLARRQQGKRPTCSAFVVTGALEFAAAQRQGHGTSFSAEFLNWAANRACGDNQDGGFFSDLWKGFAAYGICAESEMPYRPALDPAEPPTADALADAKTRLGLGLRLHWIKEWNVHTGLTDAHLQAIKQTLHQGWPVCGGLRWPKQERWVDDVLQMCPSNAVRDGHSVLVVGYRDDVNQPGGGVFIFRNTQGQGRDGFMPYIFAQAYMNDAAWVDYPAPTSAARSAMAGRDCLVADRESQDHSNLGQQTQNRRAGPGDDMGGDQFAQSVHLGLAGRDGGGDG